MVKKLILFVCMLIVVSSLGCGKKISDEEISSQIKGYFNSLEREAYLRNPRKDFAKGPFVFGEHFDTNDVSIIDRKKNDNSINVICKVTFTVKQGYTDLNTTFGHFGPYQAFNKIVGKGSGVKGDTKGGDFEFIFEKYDSGWRLTKMIEV